jgi:hypothetical protein
VYCRIIWHRSTSTRYTPHSIPGSTDTVELVGSNFAEFSRDNHIEFLGQRAPTFSEGKDCIGPTFAKVCVLEVVGMTGHRIKIADLSNAHLNNGPVGIHVQAGDVPVRFVSSMISGAPPSPLPSGLITTRMLPAGAELSCSTTCSPRRTSGI